LFPLSAQIGNSLILPNKPNVLIDNKHTKSLEQAKGFLIKNCKSYSDLIENLTEKQKAKIKYLEQDRDKKKEIIDSTIALKKESLKLQALSVSKDLKFVDKLQNDISKLAIEKQKVDIKAKKNIRCVLTTNQKLVFDKII